jgi:hypothetical protein
MSDLHFQMHADGGAGLIRELDPIGVDVSSWPAIRMAPRPRFPAGAARRFHAAESDRVDAVRASAREGLEAMGAQTLR